MGEQGTTAAHDGAPGAQRPPDSPNAQRRHDGPNAQRSPDSPNGQRRHDGPNAQRPPDGGARRPDDGTRRVGLDIGGTKVQGVLLDGDTIRRTVRLRTRPGVEGVVGTAVEAVHQLCDSDSDSDSDVDPADLAAVGMGVPGIVEPGTGTVSHAVNLGISLSAVPIGPLLSERLGGVPVTVENDLSCAALGAADLLDLTDLAFLALGTGVAAGLVLDGRLRRGHVGAAGEIGHLPYRADGPPCACGQHGCLELYASGSALAAAWPGPGVPAAQLFTAADAGDATARTARADFADAVATAVRFLVLTCDVAEVVLGGGVAELGQPLLDAVAQAVERQGAGSAFLRSLSIGDRLRLAPPGVPVGAIGAALVTRGDAPGHLVSTVVAEGGL